MAAEFPELNFDVEIERALQVQRALPHIGPLLDRWAHMSNDVKGSLKAGDDYFYELMGQLEDAWMGDR